LHPKKQQTSCPVRQPAQYVVVRFTTAFEKSPAVETVTLMLDGDRGWRVVGYFVRPG
jgi:hypothetical protein